MRVVAIVPAYNEEGTVGAVIDVLKEMSEIDEVVVISDGSTDRTAEVARDHGAFVIELQDNIGKGGAMKAGIDRADADIYVFLDADLLGLTADHVRALLNPVVSGRVDMTIGRFTEGRVATDLAHTVAPYLSGQRVVRRDILAGIEGMELARFGVEMALTRYIQRHEVKVEEVPLPHLSHRMKEEKLGLLRGFLARMREYWDIIKYTFG